MPPKTPELADVDYQFLQAQSGLNRLEIKDIFGKFMANNPDGMLDKAEFIKLYSELRHEPNDKIVNIARLVFRAFDANHDNQISFSEFLIAYALTSRGDNRKRLEYAFKLYDRDKNGYLDRDEIREVIECMGELIGVEARDELDKLVNECIGELSDSMRGRVSMDEFVDGLLRNYRLRTLMSPFN